MLTLMIVIDTDDNNGTDMGHNGNDINGGNKSGVNNNQGNDNDKPDFDNYDNDVYDDVDAQVIIVHFE